MIDRIKKILSVKSLSSTQFAAEIGVQRSGISHILSGRNKPSLYFVLKILEQYPTINESWLLKGEGEMYKNQSSENTWSEKPVLRDKELETEDVKEKSLRQKEPIETISNQQKNPNDLPKQLSDSSPISQLQSAKKSDKIIKLIAIYEDNSFDIYSPK